MKKIIITAALCFCALFLSAQEKPRYIIKGDKLERVETPKKAPVKTNWTIEIKDAVYPVWKGTEGSYFIVRTSKKTGKEYRQYIEIEDPLKSE